jgi:glutamine cyclotransferase
VVRTIELPSGYHEGLFIYGGNIWVANGNGLKTWIVDIASGKVISEIESVGNFTEGVASSGDGKFFVSEWLAKKVYRAALAGNKFVAESEISVAPAFPAGILWREGRLDVITWTRGFGTKFHLVEMDGKGTVAGRVLLRGMQEPAHLASDGKYLWVTSWYSKRVYKVDPASRKVTGYFPTPFPKATGIAWDGESFWITGTHADLYRIRVKE